MFDAVERVRLVELVGLAAFLLAGVVGVALGTWSFLSVFVELPDLVVQHVGVVDEVSYPLVLVSGLVGLALAVVLMLGWLYVASTAYGWLKGLVGWE
ncbi:hypothetical protein [Haloarchaeobius iranensis]|uniref:Cox cluster protein n=1 Tax=Haloarchaeobius iranensis TaxID=996166 RepID=A0A1G9UJS3_9EURY|nr:hypothetical protein [Haloarchaeobius iranensis]SDM60113.1 hypothetical protein SAMN05192554_104163 [Haloarchaeobius iranensis]